MENHNVSLSIRNVSKTYANGVQALSNVSLDIPCGMYGLLGPNGAGKSTLMRTIATLQEPDTGKIFLGNLDVIRQKDQVRQTLGYLPQEFGVYPRVSAEDCQSVSWIGPRLRPSGRRRRLAKASSCAAV